MNKKKAFLVILLAAILAFVLAFFALKNNNKDTSLQQVEQDEVVVPEENKIEEKNAEQEENKTLDKSETAVRPQIKPVVETKSPEVEAPIIQPLRVEEASIVIEEQEKDPGIYKEAGTSNIVITREFKAQSRSKYSFEGYGVQKAPTK